MADSLFKQYEGVFKEEESPKKETTPFEYAYKPFALQDALGEKSPKKAWIEYQKLRFAGIEAEDLVFKIVSKVRDMLVIKKGASKEDLGLKDWQYNRLKRDLKNWKEEELKHLYTKLIENYHRSRMGTRQNDYSVGRGDELHIAIEKTLLKI